ncbi:MAG: hypothetical protein FWG30_00060 [Eubacteriaceae bacterium]|nr:hypothetical protein [Eubacteriaceae bacterium]
MELLKLDALYDLIKGQYPPFGRPAVAQAEIFRAFTLMAAMGCTSVDSWHAQLSESPELCAIAGFPASSLPCLGAFYAFINRLWLLKEMPSRVHKSGWPFAFCQSVKLKKGEKLAERKPGINERLYASYFSKGRHLPKHPQHLMQAAFAALAVNPSIGRGLINEGCYESGDGTALHCHSNKYGKKICLCEEHKCRCNRRYSGPGARIGWDSGEGRNYYGYSLFMLTARDPRSSAELPTLIRFGEAQRHGSVLALVSIDELFMFSPAIEMAGLCFDSAMDNNPTYSFLRGKGVEAFIDLIGMQMRLCPNALPALL